MTETEKLTLALALLYEVRAVFRDTLKKEPASDWYVDAADFLDHPGINPEQRLAGVLHLLTVAWARLAVLKPGGIATLHEQWIQLQSSCVKPELLDPR